MIPHLVRVGAFAQVGRFVPADATVYPRGARVVVRTSRGLEIGEVLAYESNEGSPQPANGALLRGMTIDDELLAARLDRNKHQALDACQRRIEQLNLGLTLIDGETLFDGRGVYFYFLGEPPAELEGLTAELADAFDAHVQFQAFADALTGGCGPDCGQSADGDSGCGACQSPCAAKAAR